MQKEGGVRGNSNNRGPEKVEKRGPKERERADRQALRAEELDDGTG